MSEIISINLGIDFGTRFTKVCVRSEEIGVAICDFDGTGTDGALLGSALRIDEQDQIVAVGELAETDEPGTIRYLKMALSKQGLLGASKETRERLPQEPNFTRALASRYLEYVIRRSKCWVETYWKEHIGGRSIIWSANVGLPVAHYDSQLIGVFQEILAVAWKWSEDEEQKMTVIQSLERYDASLLDCEPHLSYCQAYPEIAAAVLSFATSRSSSEGIHVYFDVGGGTLDGVVFNLKRNQGEVFLNFYAGDVASLGLDWVAEQAANSPNATRHIRNFDELRSFLLREDLQWSFAGFKPFRREAEKFVGGLIWKAKKKDARDWRVDNTRVHRPGIGHLVKMRHRNGRKLAVFIGGGGMRSSFYREAILNSHATSSLHNYAIPTFDLLGVPAPPDLDLGSVPDDDYHRFLVAYGLSVPFGEGPEFRLPSVFEDVAPTRPKRDPTIPNYSDSKDIFD